MGRNICIILTFDTETEKKLKQLKEVLYAFDIEFNHNHPHITIANYPGINPTMIKKYAEHFFKEVKQFPIVFSKVEVIKSYLVAITPLDNPTLNTLYHNFHDAFDQLANEFTAVKTGKFIPHISLLFEEERNLEPLVGALKAEFTSFTGYVTGVEVSEVLPTGFKILRRLELVK